MPNTPTFYPLPLEPQLAERPWGATGPSPFFDAAGLSLGEAWLVSDGPGGSRVASGPQADMTLSRLRHLWGRRVFGGLPAEAPESVLPVEIEIVRTGPAGPVWRLTGDRLVLVLAAGEDSFLGCGLAPDVTFEDAAREVGNRPGAWPGQVRRLPAEAGRAVFMPRGTVAFPGPDLTLLTLGPPSPPHPVLYDWGRRPAGLPLEDPVDPFFPAEERRPFEPEPREFGPEILELYADAHLRVERLTTAYFSDLPPAEAVCLLAPLAGRGRILTPGPAPTTRLSPGRAVLLPSALGRYTIESNTSVTVLRVFVSYRPAVMPV